MFFDFACGAALISKLTMPASDSILLVVETKDRKYS